MEKLKHVCLCAVPVCMRARGMTLQRMGQAVRHGIPLVLEQGTDPEDDLSAVVRVLGGVHLVPFECLAPTVQWVLGEPTLWRLTSEELARWQAYRDALFAWDGGVETLRRLLTPAAWG